MATSDDLTVLTATGLETAAARKALPGVRVEQAGIALAGVTRRYDGTAVSCGVAGGLRRGMSTGTVLIPRSVRRPGGGDALCDPELQDRFAAAARALGAKVVEDPLLTSSVLLHGPARGEWASRGFAGVDMETGLIDALRIGCVRVVLDTPEREIHPAWEHPKRVLLHPRALLDLPFLAREGPRCAALAAQIIAKALR